MENQTSVCEKLARETENAEHSLSEALLAEHLVARADRELNTAPTLFRRLTAKWHSFRTRRTARNRSRRLSDVLGTEASEKQIEQLGASWDLLRIAAENRTGEASKNARNQLREFSKLLARDQANFKNFRVFDRMKGEPDRCHMLLGILPCWIMSPDDVARLFPCEAGLFVKSRGYSGVMSTSSAEHCWFARAKRTRANE